MLARWVPGAATALLAVLVLGCTGTTAPEDDPAEALTTAFATLATYEGVGLTVTTHVSDRADADEFLTSLTAARFELRSDTTRAAHLRVPRPDDAGPRDLVDDTAEQLRTVGLAPVADALEGGGWIRIATDALEDPGEDSDRLARALGAAGTSLLDDATVTSLGDEERGHHVRVTSDADAARRFVDDVAAAIADTGRGSSTRSRPSDDTSEGQVSLDAWLTDGELTGVRIDLPAVLGPTAVPLVVEATVSPSDGAAPVPDDAPPAAVGSLVDAFSLATGHERSTSPDDGGPTAPDASSPDDAQPDDTRTDGTTTDGPTTTGDGPAGDDGPATGTAPDTRPTEPPQLREGGVLEEVFGDGEAFVEGEGFDCLTDEDLALLEEQFGPAAREEIDELVTAGYLQRC